MRGEFFPDAPRAHSIYAEYFRIIFTLASALREAGVPVAAVRMRQALPKVSAIPDESG